MKKLFTIAIAATGALMTAACSGDGNDAATGTTNAGAEIGNLTGDEAPSGNEVTAVDGDSALANGHDPTAVPPEVGSATDLVGNPADPTANLAGPSGNAFRKSFDRTAGSDTAERRPAR